MIEASCHCGAVRHEVDTAPETVTSCTCSICRRYGTLWAYYSPKARVRIAGATDIYMWGDRDLEFHRCKTYGCVTHWASADKIYERMAVNARLMPHEIFEVAAIRHTEGPSSPAA